MDTLANDQRTPSEPTDITGLNQPASAEMSESETILRAQCGDASAFERLYLLHSPRVYGLCLRMLGNASEAEDVTQEVFLLVWRKIRTFRGESAFATWLHRLTVNLVLMRLRRKSRLETPLDECLEPDGNRSGLRAELARPDLRLTGSLDRLHLERALQQLRPFQKLVVVLHDIQGYKHTEIARIMDWSIGNSKSQLHRARTRLRKLLQESLPFACLTARRADQAAFSV
jgi:RNA polymerase sigma-70 factor, ECF subfamily